MIATTTHTVPASRVLSEAVHSGVLDEETLDELHTYVDGQRPADVLGEALACGALDTESLLRLAGIDPTTLDLDVTTLDLVGENLVVGRESCE